MSRLSGIVLIIMIAGSCTDSPPPGLSVPAEDSALAPLFPVQASISDCNLEIVARVRLDLPKYRIKGACAVFRSDDGSVQIDFVHTSLFGSYREDATIFVASDSIAIQDNERGIFRGRSETLAHLSAHFEFEILPGDVIVFMLLAMPQRDDMVNARLSVSGGSWILSGEWRGRHLEIEGEEGLGPLRLRICSVDGTGCYEARYRYDSTGRLGGYPERIVCERLGGSEKLSMNVESVVRSGGARAAGR